MRKNRYIVFIQDEWNNLWWIGEYSKLSEALPDVNSFLDVYNVQLNELKEYTCTFGSAFDKEIETESGEIIMVRGFIIKGDKE